MCDDPCTLNSGSGLGRSSQKRPLSIQGGHGMKRIIPAKSAILMMVTTVIIALSSFAVITGTATPALAVNGGQWCDTGGYCPNAWDGGPFVKSESYPARNNDFAWVLNLRECNGGITTSTCPGHGIPAGLG